MLEQKQLGTDFNQAEMIQGVIDAIPTPIYFRNKDSICLRCNKAFQKLVGLSAADIIGKDADGILFGNDREATLMLDEMLLSLRIEQNFEAVIHGAEGMLSVNVFRTAYYDFQEKADCIAIAIIDVTSRKQASMALNRSLAILNGVLESSHDGFLAIQQTNNENIVVGSNRKLFSLFGLPELIGGNFSDLTTIAARVVSPAGFWPRFVERCADVTQVYHETIETVDGKILEEYSMPFYNGYEVVGRVLSFHDITEERLAAEKLQESNDRNQALWYQSSDGIFVFDPSTLKIQETNKKLAEMLGYTIDALMELTVTEIESEEQAVVTRAIRSIISAGSYFFGPLKFRRGDGSLVDAEVTATVIRFRQKQVILVTARDISERVRLEDQILADVYVGAKVQRQFLPPDFHNQWIAVRGIYEPFYKISGDTYHFSWEQEQQILSGVLLDVSGHGVATSLMTSALLPLAKEAMSKGNPLNERVAWFNRESQRWFSMDNYAAGIFFEIDLTQNIVRYVPAGISCFLRSSKEYAGLIKAPGFLLGLFPDVEYDLLTFPIHAGDSVYFLTDGVSDLLDSTSCSFLQEDFLACVEALSKVATDKTRLDDTTVLCIHIGDGALSEAELQAL